MVSPDRTSSTRLSSYLSASAFISSSRGASIILDGTRISIGITAFVSYVDEMGFPRWSSEVLFGRPRARCVAL